MQSKSGRWWAYFGVILGFAASITANIASVAMKTTEVSLWLRVPFAIFWPLATYVAIEVLVRIDWDASWTHRWVRVIIWGPVGLVAAFVSYLHQHHLMVLADEPGLAQGFGPLAVDGMLFGMTAALIVTRKRSVPPVQEAPAVELAASQPIEPGIDWDKELAEWSAPVPVSPAPVSAPPAESAPRSSRASWDARKVVEMILDGEKAPQIIETTGIGRSTLARYVSVTRELRETPRAEIKPERKVPAAHVSLIRELVSR